MRVGATSVLVDVAGPSPGSAVVFNNGPAAVFYGATAAVTSSSFDGTVAVGGTVTLTAPAWFITAPRPVGASLPVPADIDVRQVTQSPSAQSGSANIDGGGPTSTYLIGQSADGGTP